MSRSTLHMVFSLGLLTLVMGSCDKDLNQIRKHNQVRLSPTSQVENFVLKYTDSARIKSILQSPLMYDYSGVKFPFTEFPTKVEVTIYDAKGQRTFIEAKYAITFGKTNIYDLRDQVKIRTENGRLLETDQLYYDRSTEWVFTEKDCKLSDTDGVYDFKGFDAKSDLTQLEARNFKGQGAFSE